QVHDPKAGPFRPERAEDEPFAVWRKRGERVVTRPCRYLVETAAVRIHDRHLRASFDAILRGQEETMESVEERFEAADAEDHLISARRPLRPENVAALVVVDHLRLLIPRIRDQD